MSSGLKRRLLICQCTVQLSRNVNHGQGGLQNTFVGTRMVQPHVIKALPVGKPHMQCAV